MIGSQLRLRQALAPAVLLGPAWFVLDHVLPELFHKQLQLAAPWLAGIATLVGGVAAVQLGWHWLIGRLPPPWIARPFWRSIAWLRYRPSVRIITAAVSGNIVGDIVDSCAFSLTLGRNLTFVQTSATIAFETARLVMTQVHGGETRRTLFKPTNTSGFLDLPVHGGQSDFVRVVFEAVGLPIAAADAPDFHGDYSLELTGVRATLFGPKPIAGELAPAEWLWFATFNTGALVPSLGADQMRPDVPIQWPRS